MSQSAGVGPETRTPRLSFRKPCWSITCESTRELPTVSDGATSKRKPRAELNLSSRSCSFSDGTELWRIDETVRRAEIYLVESIKEFGAKLKFHFLSQGELTLQSEIECLQPRAINRVPPHIAKGERGRSCERRR